MLYSEFVKGTGCRENDHNYQVYRNLEVMYMNSDMTKQEIYEYGKKLVDNSKSEAELRVEARIREDIAGFERMIETCKQCIEWYEYYLTLDRTDDEKKGYRQDIKDNKAEIRDYKARIRFLKDCLD